MDVLFPPVLESQGLAFPYAGQDVTSKRYEIRFPLPLGTSPESIGHAQVSIKDLNTGVPAVSKAVSPDKQVLYIKKASTYFRIDDEGNGIIELPYFAWINGAPALNTTYCIQIRFGSTGLWDGAGTGLEGSHHANFAAWRIACTTTIPSTFGEWSNIMKSYCYKAATHFIAIDFNDFMPRVSWSYRTPQDVDDPIEQIKLNYWFGTVHGTEMRTDVFSGQYQGDNNYSFQTVLPVAPVTNIRVGVEAVTKNNTKYNDTVDIQSIQKNLGVIQVPAGMNPIKDILMSAPEQEDGVIGKEIKAPDTLQYIKNPNDPVPNYGTCKAFNVYRINLLTTECVKIINKQAIVANEVVAFKDYTCEMGEEYQYVAIAIDETGRCRYYLNSLTPYGDTNPGYGRLMRMDSTYLVSRAHQLRLQGNVQVSGLKRNTQDAFQTTIGSKYPFYSRASKMNYRTFSLNGVVSINFDPTSSFLRLDAIGKIDKGQVLDYNQYSVLIAKSPGLEPFFTQAFDGEGYPIYIFQGSNNPDILSDEECIALVNRCASTLALNGLWWDNDDGDYSQLYILDKDIVETKEVSLSRERRSQNKKWIAEGLHNKDDGSLDIKRSDAITGIYDKYLHRQTGLNYGTDKTDKMVYIERKFRDKVMEWLSDGKPKLYRSETEGNMIVMLSGVSFTPLDKTGRMVYSVAMTVTEIADLTSENLLKFNLVPSLIQSVYIDNQVYQYTWGQFDQAVNTNLTYQYYDIFEIPAMQINNAEGAIEIPTYPGVFHASKLENLTFTAENLPNGLKIQAKNEYNADGSLLREAGTIYGYPQDIDPMSPGFAILQVEDSEKHQTAKMTVPYGWMYAPLERVKPGERILITSKLGKDTINIGEEIAPIDLTQYHQGGVGPYTYAPGPKRLPDGINVNGITGQVTGTYSSAVNAGTSNVIVRDSLGNSLTLELEYVPGLIPLTFIKQTSWDFSYLEAGMEIPDGRVLSEGVTGGFLIEGGNYHFALGDDAPTGIVIDEATGILSGAPSSSSPPGYFTVSVHDDNDVYRSITINYNTILETFRFEERQPDYPIQKIWIPSNDINDDGTPKDIILGTIVVGIDVKPYVSGGLPYTNGAPYRFTAIGLLPDWEITKEGIMKGKARTAMPAHEAVLIAQDARGEKRRCTIKIGEVVGGIEFAYGNATVKNLYVGEEIQPEDITWDSGGGLANPLIILKNAIVKGTEPYTITPNSFPDGISLRPLADSSGWEIYGTPTTPDAGRIGWLVITDKNGYNLRVQINFDPVIQRLHWKEEGTVIVSGAPEQIIERPLGALGGLMPYTAVVNGVAAEYVTIVPGNANDLETWKLRFTLPAEGRYSQSAEVVISDRGENGISITKSFNIRTNATKLKLKWVADFRNTVAMQNHAIFNTKVAEISGGTGGYAFRGGQNIGGGLYFAIDGNDVKLMGTPTDLVSTHENIAKNLVITDDEESGQVSLDAAILGPIIVPQPIIGNNVQNGVLQKDGLLYLQSYTSPNIFEKLIFPGYSITDNYNDGGRLPGGIFRDNSIPQAMRVSGQATAKTSENTEIIYTLRTPETNYDAVIELSVRVIFGAIQGVFEYFIPTTLAIPALGVNQEMTPIVISDNLTGGAGPFTWTITGQPVGLMVQVDPADSRKASIVGTPTEKTGEGSILVTVMDTSNGATVTAQLRYAGVFDQLKLEKPKVEIPPMVGGADLENIPLDGYVSGGQEPYTFTDNSVMLEIRGYYIRTAQIMGKASEYGFEEKNGNILVTDAMGQTILLPYTVGKITGNLFYNANAAGVKASIPNGDHDAILANPGNYIDLLPGVSGGTENYTFAENINNGWSRYGFQIEIDNATGKATKIVYPSEPLNPGSFDVDIGDGNAVVKASVAFGEVKGLLAFKENAQTKTEIIVGTPGAAIPNADLPVIAPGIVGGVKPYRYAQSPTNGWVAKGFQFTLDPNTGAFSNGKYPSTAVTAAGTFTVVVTDAENKSINVDINYTPSSLGGG